MTNELKRNERKHRAIVILGGESIYWMCFLFDKQDPQWQGCDQAALNAQHCTWGYSYTHFALFPYPSEGNFSTVPWITVIENLTRSNQMDERLYGMKKKDKLREGAGSCIKMTAKSHLSCRLGCILCAPTHKECSTWEWFWSGFSSDENEAKAWLVLQRGWLRRSLRLNEHLTLLVRSPTRVR